MSRLFAALILTLLATLAFANDATKELDESAGVIRNMTASHQIPADVLANTECIAIIPAMAKAAIVVGGAHGNGVVSCRTRNGWSAPGFVTISAGSVGLQAGLQHQDLVLLMNKQGEQQLSQGEWSVGAEAAAAGPNTPGSGGPQSSGWKTPVLVYTSSSGAYAGVSLEGAKITVDQPTLRALYGPNASFQSVLNGEVQPTGSAQAFLSALNQVAGNK